jgi:hypothetical protein
MMEHFTIKLKIFGHSFVGSGVPRSIVDIHVINSNPCNSPKKDFKN